MSRLLISDQQADLSQKLRPGKTGNGAKKAAKAPPACSAPDINLVYKSRKRHHFSASNQSAGVYYRHSNRFLISDIAVCKPLFDRLRSRVPTSGTPSFLLSCLRPTFYRTVTPGSSLRLFLLAPAVITGSRNVRPPIYFYR